MSNAPILNWKNPSKVSSHLARLIKTNSQLQNAIRELEEIKRSIDAPFKPFLTLGPSGTIDTCQFYSHANKKELEDSKDYFGELGLSLLCNRIAWCMQQIDYPISKSQAKAFCDFYGFSDESKKVVMDAALDDMNYQEWVDEERHRYCD